MVSFTMGEHDNAKNRKKYTVIYSSFSLMQEAFYICFILCSQKMKIMLM